MHILYFICIFPLYFLWIRNGEHCKFVQFWSYFTCLIFYVVFQLKDMYISTFRMWKSDIPKHWFIDTSISSAKSALIHSKIDPYYRNQPLSLTQVENINFVKTWDRIKKCWALKWSIVFAQMTLIARICVISWSAVRFNSVLLVFILSRIHPLWSLPSDWSNTRWMVHFKYKMVRLHCIEYFGIFFFGRCLIEHYTHECTETDHNRGHFNVSKVCAIALATHNNMKKISME